MPLPQYIDIPNEDRRMNAQGPMALESRKAYDKQLKSAGQEYEIELKALRNQGLPPDQFRKKVATLHGKHELKAYQMKQDWDQKMTMIQQYEKLGAAGTISQEESTRSQFALSGYNIAKQQKPDYWAEHRNIIQERERIQQMNDDWDFRKGRWRLVTAIHTKGKKKDLPKKWGREASPQEVAQIKGVQDSIKQLDQYEFDLLSQMDPRQRKVNQLSRAMAMGPRTQNTMGVGGKREGLPLGQTKKGSNFVFPGGYLTPAVKAEPERFETQGYKMTREKAIQQATSQLGVGASKERVLTLAKQIYGAE